MTDNQNPFGVWSNPILAMALVASWFFLLFVFASVPQIDLAVAHLFFSPEDCAASGRPVKCDGFPVEQSSLAWTIREMLHYLPLAISVGLLLLVIIGWWRGRRWQDASFRIKVALVATMAIVSGLIVNVITKPLFGRPRPWQTEQFGGTMPFVEAGSMAGLCEGNCSFLSGESAGGGWLICLAALFPPDRRTEALIVLTLAGVTMTVLRVAFGAHFLSDAVLSFLLSMAVFACFAVAFEARERRPQLA